MVHLIGTRGAILWLWGFTFAVRQVYALSVSIPLFAASAVPRISSSHLSLSIEQDRWTDWVGTTSRNEFFHNTLDNLAQLTGTPPQIRIGANSEDHTNFDKDVQFAQAVFPPPTVTVPYPGATNITVGDSYYKSARFLPPNTHVTWGVNFGQNNITAAVLQARSIVKAFSCPSIRSTGITLDYLELGNEPDLYMNNGLRARTYSSSQYVTEWINFAKDVSAAARLTPASKTKFLGASFAGSSHTTMGFSPQAVFNAGLLTSKPGGLISAISQHRYSGSFCSGNGGLLQDLMTKSTIRGNLTVFIPDIRATHSHGLDYILGETNSYACHGAPGVSNTAGAALWTLDYALFTTQLGISRVFFHVGVGFKYSLIQPIELTRSILDGSTLSAPQSAHVQPQYYAAIIAAEAIGNSGSAQALELAIDHPRVAGYAFYENNMLARAVLINSQAFLKGQTERTSVHIDLGFSSGGFIAAASMTVKRLAVGFADDASGLTWGGQSYETTDGRVTGNLDVECVPVSAGVDIQETEVVMLAFH